MCKSQGIFPKHIIDAFYEFFVVDFCQFQDLWQVLQGDKPLFWFFLEDALLDQSLGPP